MPVRAFLFDFDGLILDTETASRAGWQWLYRQHGHELPPDRWALMVGTVDGWDIWGHLEELVGKPLDREHENERRYAHELTLLEVEELRPGIADYLGAAERLGLKRAIVSSASRHWVDMHLERLERSVGWDAIVTADHDAERAKPRPDPVPRGARGARRSTPPTQSRSRTRRTVPPPRRPPASSSSVCRTASRATSASPTTPTSSSTRSPTSRRTS